MAFATLLRCACLTASLATFGSARADPAGDCLRAADRAEHRWGLPAGLLAAIGEVESGRADPATGRARPWPWSANVAGGDRVFETATEAVFTVEALRRLGVASIDVGCFQVNLRHHPHAFASVAEGFDPATNADYAGRFLRDLYRRSGSWEWAIAAYHSAEPALGTPYRAHVLRAWFARSPGPSARDPAGSVDRYAPMAGPAAQSIPVYTPRTLPASLRPAFFAAPGGTRLVNRLLIENSP